LQAVTRPITLPSPQMPPSSAAQKKNLNEASGLYLQIAAFLSLQTAEQLKERLSQSLPVPSFISPLAIDGQILHRVRLGPITHLDDAKRLQQEVERLGLGLPLVVRP